MLTIPLEFGKDRPAFQTLKVTLEGSVYYLRLEWNMRHGWYLGIQDSSQSVIFHPRRLVADYDFLGAVSDNRRPPGKLVLADTTGQGMDPTFESLGREHVLYYVESSEL
jgi:hypothetical protein